VNRKNLFLILLAAWFLMISSYVAYKEYLLNFGTEIMLRTVPVDPRDLFRGDYVILNYEISEISENQKIINEYGGYVDEENLYNRQTVYVTLIKDGDYYIGGDIYTERPPKGLFIKGLIDKYPRPAIIYGIENFFVPEDEGKEIEHARNINRVSAKIAVNAYGHASIKELYIDGKKVVFKHKNEEIY